MTDRDRGAGAAPVGEEALAALAGPYGRHGLALTRLRPATPADVAASRSTWGKRLGAGTRRPAWLLEARLAGAVSAQPGQAGAGLVEAAGGGVHAGPRVGGGEPVGDVTEGVPSRLEAVQLRPVQRD